MQNEALKICLENFQAAVLAKLPRITDPIDEQRIRKYIPLLHLDGFSVLDAMEYCLCFEEVNPLLDEEVALKRMELIRNKYYQNERSFN